MGIENNWICLFTQVPNFVVQLLQLGIHVHLQLQTKWECILFSEIIFTYSDVEHPPEWHWPDLSEATGFQKDNFNQ